MAEKHSLIYLIPRFLGTFLVLLIFAFFLEFSADDFQFKTFFTASIPGILVLIALIVAWIMEGMGALLFVIYSIIGILYPFASGQPFHWGFLILPGWSLLVGSLFLLSKYRT